MSRIPCIMEILRVAAKRIDNRPGRPLYSDFYPSPDIDHYTEDSRVGIGLERGICGVFRRKIFLIPGLPVSAQDDLSPFVGQQNDASIVNIIAWLKNHQVSVPDRRRHEIPFGDDGEASLRGLWETDETG